MRPSESDSASRLRYSRASPRLVEEDTKKEHGDDPPHSPKLAEVERLSPNNRAHVLEVMIELTVSLANHIHDAPGSNVRRQSVLPHEEFVYPDYNPDDQSSYGSEEEDGAEEDDAA